MEDSASNRLIFCHQIELPEMLLCDLMCLYFDLHTLKECQLVCKHWNILIKDYVWRRKAELRGQKKYIRHDSLTWLDYRAMVENDLFNRNLIRNHSGENGLEHSWTILKSGGDGWDIECPPLGIPPLPIEDGFDEQRCFVTSNLACSKFYKLSLGQVGFTPSILDTIQPPIEISEWYGSSFDIRAFYCIKIELRDENEKVLACDSFTDHIRQSRLNNWYKYVHVFRKYGKGVRSIWITHMGKDTEFWSGHYGSKMARTCVKFLTVETDTELDRSCIK